MSRSSMVPVSQELLFAGDVRPGKAAERRLDGVLRYGFGAVSVALAVCLALTLPLFDIEGDNYFGFYAAIAATMWFCGVGPGCMAVVLATLSVAFFLTPPVYSLHVDPSELPGFVFFLICAATSLALSARLRRMERNLRRAHDDLGVTVERRTEELQQANAALRAEIAERERDGLALQEAQAQLGRVLRMATLAECAAVAHEVKQPLTAIAANAGACRRFLAREQPAVDDARTAIDAVIGDSERARAIIARIGALLRNRKPQLGPVDLSSAISDVVELVRDHADQFGVRMLVDLPPSLPPVSGDAIQLQQVLLNLINNAVDAMAANGDAPRNLRVQPRAATGFVEVAVEDSGVGLGHVDPARLFDGFFTTKRDGLGLGLRISQSIIHAHGGQLWASPAQPRGAIFRFTVPTMEPAAR